MLPQVRWWRTKPTRVVGVRPGWFEPGTSYPGFIVQDRACRGNVRVFRDLQAFTAYDGSFSMDIPLTTLDEVPAPA